MTYAEVCEKIESLGGTPYSGGGYVMPTPQLHLVPFEDYEVKGVVYEGPVNAEAWDGEQCVALFAVVGRDQVEAMLPDLSAQAVLFAGGEG
jgi:hypothetical protein